MKGVVRLTDGLTIESLRNIWPVLALIGTLGAILIGAMVGTYAGFLALMKTTRDKPQAGLPFLNSGAILGFLLGCVLAGVRPF